MIAFRNGIMKTWFFEFWLEQMTITLKIVVLDNDIWSSK